MYLSTSLGDGSVGIGWSACRQLVPVARMANDRVQSTARKGCLPGSNGAVTSPQHRLCYPIPEASERRGIRGRRSTNPSTLVA